MNWIRSYIGQIHGSFGFTINLQILNNLTNHQMCDATLLFFCLVLVKFTILLVYNESSDRKTYKHSFVRCPKIVPQNHNTERQIDFYGSWSNNHSFIASKVIKVKVPTNLKNWNIEKISKLSDIHIVYSKRRHAQCIFTWFNAMLLRLLITFESIDGKRIVICYIFIL